jgi:hypothetical protein
MNLWGLKNLKNLFFRGNNPWWILGTIKCLILKALNLDLKMLLLGVDVQSQKKIIQWKKLSFMGTTLPRPPIQALCMKPWMVLHVPRRLSIASESVTLTIRERNDAFGPRNPWTQREFWRSVHGIRGRNESSGVRSTESVNATRVLAFGPRNPCIYNSGPYYI